MHTTPLVSKEARGRGRLVQPSGSTLAGAQVHRGSDKDEQSSGSESKISAFPLFNLAVIFGAALDCGAAPSLCCRLSVHGNSEMQRLHAIASLSCTESATRRCTTACIKGLRPVTRRPSCTPSTTCSPAQASNTVQQRSVKMVLVKAKDRDYENKGIKCRDNDDMVHACWSWTSQRSPGMRDPCNV